jgi:glycosyltransferase involved in cell wall biosynthesis
MYTVAILTHNAETTLEATLRSISDSPEIVVVDDDSTDRTRDIVSSKRVRYIRHSLYGDFSQARTFAMQEAKHDWILFLDADETLSDGYDAHIKKLLQNDTTIAGYFLRREDLFWGTRLTMGEVYTAAHKGILRLVHRRRGTWKGKVHEVFVPAGRVATAHDVVLTHTPHATISSFLNDINTYSSIRSTELESYSRYRLWIEMVCFPPLKFIFTYVVLGGFIHGPAGFVYSFMMSFHSFLVRAKSITSRVL